LNDQPLAGKSILVLEDEFLIAMDVEQLCRDCGAGEVSIVRSLEEADRADCHATIDVAILDVMLGDRSTFDFARTLIEKGVPFLFTTGYSDPETLAAQFPGVEVVNKPYAGPDLIRALLDTLARQTGQPVVDPVT